MPNCAVLVVDDDPAIRETIGQILEYEGHPVQTAANGKEALAILEQDNLDVVLLDMRMPILDGWGFAAAAKARGVRTPIVVMTAARDARAWAQEIEAAGYLPKPFELTELLSIVDRFCA
jgi:two-component system, chemotaxis family, chemotaxis protein CheY